MTLCEKIIVPLTWIIYFTGLGFYVYYTRAWQASMAFGERFGCNFIIIGMSLVVYLWIVVKGWDFLEKVMWRKEV